MRTSYFLNLNFVCNERCTFCAADLADGAIRTPGRPRGLTMDDVERFLDRVPDATDHVLLAGGEPTLHPNLIEIVDRVAGHGARVVLFTNALALADYARAAEVVAAGVTEFQVALFGSTAARHDAVTRTPGSFETTIAALNVLGSLQRERPSFRVVGRLLVTRQLLEDNPAIVSVFAERTPHLDAVSLNRLVLSQAAARTDSPVSWAEARASVNECARRIRAAGFHLEHESIPLCVFEGDNADWVEEIARRRLSGPLDDLRPYRFAYIDPRTAIAGLHTDSTDSTSANVALATPRVCVGCDYLPICGRVEQWSYDRFGTAGLHSIRRGRKRQLAVAVDVSQ